MSAKFISIVSKPGKIVAKDRDGHETTIDVRGLNKAQRNEVFSSLMLAVA